MLLFHTPRLIGNLLTLKFIDLKDDFIEKYLHKLIKMEWAVAIISGATLWRVNPVNG